MTFDGFVSYAQNGEDVILWRALRGVANGRYLDVGAFDPLEHSVTKAFYERGWRGVNVEPLPGAAQRLRADRPEDEVVQAAVTADVPGEATFHHFIDTGLSTFDDEIAVRHEAHGFERRDITVLTTTLDVVVQGSSLLSGDIHFLKIDVEGVERQVISSLDWRKHRPWVVVVEATEPGLTTPSHHKWENLLLEADYEFCLFDGLSRYYVAADHPELKQPLSYPACVFDEFVTIAALREREEAANAKADRVRLWDDVVHWRRAALHAWSDGFGKVEDLERRRSRLRLQLNRRRREVKDLNAEVEWMRNSLSWRITKPLRWARSRRRSRPVAPEGGVK